MRSVPLLASVVLLTGACTDDRAGSPAGGAVTAGPRIELRLVSDSPGPGLEQSEWEGSDLWLESEPVVSEADFTSLTARLRGERLLLHAELGEGAGERLRAVTGANVGRRLAMLVDGRPVLVSEIRDALGYRIGIDIPIDIDGPLSPEEAERIAAGIDAARDEERPEG